MHSQLRSLMGENMVEVEEMLQLFGLTLAPQDLDRFGEMPFSGQTLQSCARSTDFELLPLATFSIVALGRRCPEFFFAREQHAWWKGGRSCAEENGGHGTWCLIRRRPLFVWSGMRWCHEGHTVMSNLSLSREERLPSARVLVYTALLRFLRNGERWLNGFYAPSSDFVDGRRVYVGYNDAGGLDVVWGRDHMFGYAFGPVTEQKPLPCAELASSFVE